MPMQLLERLCCVRMPLHMGNDADIEKSEALRTAGWIEADLPPLLHVRRTSRFSGEAIVMRVTEAGVAALRRSRSTMSRSAFVTPSIQVSPELGPLLVNAAKHSAGRPVG